MVFGLVFDIELQSYFVESGLSK